MKKGIYLVSAIIIIITGSLLAATGCGSQNAPAASPVPAAETGEGIIAETESEFVALYLTILDEIWEDGAGLNPSNGLMVFDFSELNNLTDEQKNELIDKAGARFGAGETMAATFDELEEKGYIDETRLQFKDENSLLISIATSKEKKNSFNFKASKWVSGLGAYWFEDCTANKKSGKWSYELGGFAVS
jgi:hypothetical protein